ncbi:tetratricopeptide repeat protein [Tautonia rosea]|uniref:tetratricopeptide repeat protein n=1 Tax=Tautonia rosea TaxID=2728037 RepID=UPI001472F2E9|nr:tetratricopeptide repeat protein [Tautonia rosea]
MSPHLNPRRTVPHPPGRQGNESIHPGWKKRLLLLGGGLLLGLFGLVLLVTPRPDPDQLWQEAQQSLKAGRIPEADLAAKRLSQLRPPTDADLMLLAQVAIAQDRTEDALSILDELPNSSPLRPQAALLAGQLELRRDRMKIAEGKFLQAIELDPRLTQAYRELIYIYGFRKQSEEIDETFRRLSQLGPLTANEAFIWSLIRGVQWSTEEIVETLSRAVEADPKDDRSRIALADALLEMTRFHDAEAVLSPLDPSLPDARAALGRLALERGDVPTLRALLADGPDNHAGIELLRGKLALQFRDPDAAVESYRSALALRPNDREALSGLTQALNQAGMQGEALEIVERLNQVNALNNLLNELPSFDGNPGADRYLELGRICETIGFIPQARTWYQNAIRTDPFHKDAQRALARIGGEPTQVRDIETEDNEID